MVSDQCPALRTVLSTFHFSLLTTLSVEHSKPNNKLPSANVGSKSFLFVLHRKEVIQPLVLERLPCYDFTPVAYPTFDGVLLAVVLPASGVTNSHGVTGGVY